jgi:hypothetical protein
MPNLGLGHCPKNGGNFKAKEAAAVGGGVLSFRIIKMLLSIVAASACKQCWLAASLTRWVIETLSLVAAFVVYRKMVTSMRALPVTGAIVVVALALIPIDVKIGHQAILHTPSSGMGDSVELQCVWRRNDGGSDVFITNSDVAHAHACELAGEGYGVRLVLTPEAGEKLAEKTRLGRWTHVDFLIRGKKVASTEVVAPVEGRGIIIPLGTTRTAAENLASTIMNGP